jgi:glycosyltransferase involved in cell wall biosynthesis
VTDVALFLSSLPRGAIQRVAINLACELGRRGRRVDLVAARLDGTVPDALPAGVRVVGLDALSTRVPWVRAKRRRWLPASAPDLASYLRRERPRAVIACGNYANLAALAARRLAGIDLPVVLSEHNPISLTCRNPRRRRLFLPALVKTFYPRGDAIVAVSEGVADDLAAFVPLPRARIDAIHNPVLTPELAARADAALDDPWLRPGEPPVVLAVGRLAVQKDFATLLRAFARVRAVRPARLLILGEGDRRAELERVAGELGVAADVRLPGFVENPLAYMRRAAVFALSSIYEGFGNVVVEALACGCPVVSTDCPGGPAEILGHGRFGRLVRVGDAAALGDALLAAVAAPRDPEALAARARDFSAGAIAERYLDVLSRVGAGTVA